MAYKSCCLCCHCQSRYLSVFIILDSHTKLQSVVVPSISFCQSQRIAKGVRSFFCLPFHHRLCFLSIAAVWCLSKAVGRVEFANFAHGANRHFGDFLVGTSQKFHALYGVHGIEYGVHGIDDEFLEMHF